MIRLRRFLMTTAFLAIRTAAAAQATLPDPALDALVAEATANAPERSAAQARVEAATRRIVPASTLPDPFLTLTYQNDGRALSLGEREGSFAGVMLSQALPWPGKLALARSAARSEAREVEPFLDRASLTIEARVRNAWYDLVLARTIDRIADERRETAAQIEAAVRERYATGLAVQQDVLRAQIELARIDERKAAQAATIAARTAELDRLLGRTQDASIATPNELPFDESLASTDALIAFVASRSPEVAASRRAVETANVRVGVAKKNFLPDFVVTAGSMSRGGFDMGPMWQVGAGVTLPVWIDRRQQNQLVEARAEVRARDAEAGMAIRDLEIRTRERIARLEATLRVAKLYRERILPLDALALESALASYQAGKVPFLTVLDALNALFDDRAMYAERLADSAKGRVAIDTDEEMSR